MNHDRMRGSGPRRNGAIAAMLSMVGFATSAQTAAPSGSTASDPNPYYLGVSQALTYDTNATRSPSGPSDLYSSTSLLGGFDQPIGRQRIFGNAIVAAGAVICAEAAQPTRLSIAVIAPFLRWLLPRLLSWFIGLSSKGSLQRSEPADREPCV